MALTDRNILITPNKGASTEPTIKFTGADTSSSATITLRVINSGTAGTLSFEGVSGQLFSLTDSMAGTIFSVNDVSGIPSIEVLDTGLVKLAQYNGYVSIPGSTNATSTNTGVLQVAGGVGVGRDLYVGGTIYRNGVSIGSGAQGAQGVQGAPGNNGNNGSTGAQGVQGAPGNNGNNGSTGAQGFQGVQGAPGNNGNNGSTGAQGVQGAPGNNGNNGATGAQGATGSPGAQGSAGAQGAQGQAGTITSGNYGQIAWYSATPSTTLQGTSTLTYTGNVNLSVTGSINATSNITAYSSDRRLKTNVKQILNAVDKVKTLSGFTYNWNALANQLAGFSEEESQIGVFAQDVQEIQPEVVKPAPFDTDVYTGKSKSGENYLTVQYDKLTPLLIEAIKELTSRIEHIEQILDIKK